MKALRSRYQLNPEEATVLMKINNALISEESDFVAGDVQRHTN